VTTVKEGDRVVFERYGAVQLEGQQRLCKERHILALLTDAA
jgi:co-chaperonin GroES (HSP10)